MLCEQRHLETRQRLRVDLQGIGFQEKIEMML